MRSFGGRGLPGLQGEGRGAARLSPLCRMALPCRLLLWPSSERRAGCEAACDDDDDGHALAVIA